MSMKLRDLIRNVRACKTAAEERAVISKECALIRTSFKGSASNNAEYRHRNVAKLLYIHMLGYPTHFGQMEALKLIASPKFAEKRIGYLGLMLLLDERHQVLMLVTNSLKNDFSHQNPYVSGLALCSLGNISSVEIARDLSNEVEKFFRSPNAYLRKKAALCACRIIRKAPDLAEDFVQAAHQLVDDKNHAVLLTGLTLIIEMIKQDPKMAATFRRQVPTLVRLLKNLVLAGYVSEYDVVGITDPFLQVRIIHLLRLLGTGDSAASDQMNDILAQVAINTETTKNPGNAILYETVMTIMSIEAEGGLRVLGINILGRFLLNRDNNIRYVALSTLCKVVSRDTQAVQRHRNTIVDCLKDSDISIRRRALDLIYALVTKNNVEALVKELLNYLALTSGDQEFKSDLTDKICMVAERFAPNRLWHIETIINVLATAGSFTKENVATDLIQLISRSGEHSSYCAHKLFAALKKRTHHLPLTHVALWAVGEYGSSLLTEEGASEATEQSVDESNNFSQHTEAKVLEVLKKIITQPIATHVTREYALNALVKLSAHFEEEQASLRELLGSYRTSMSLELQQRSCEYFALAGPDMSGIRSGVVARMPVMKKKKAAGAAVVEEKEDDSGSDSGSGSGSDSDSDDSDSDSEEEEPAKKPAKATKAAEPAKPAGDLMDLFAMPNGDASSAAATAPAAAASTGGDLDFMAGLFDAPAPQQAAAQPAQSGGASDFDMFGFSSAPAAVATVDPPGKEVHNSKGLSIKFEYHATGSMVELTAHFVNSNSGEMTKFDFQVAVPKYLKLTMSPSSSNVIPPNKSGEVTQKIKLDNSLHGQKKVMIRVRISYVLDGKPVTEQAQIDNMGE